MYQKYLVTISENGVTREVPIAAVCEESAEIKVKNQFKGARILEIREITARHDTQTIAVALSEWGIGQYETDWICQVLEEVGIIDPE